LRGLGSVLAASLLCLSGCQSKPDQDPLLERAAFGVFFGGQIQDRKELPFELDAAKQSCGIRIDFREPLVRSLKLSWEIARPLHEKAGKSPASAERVTEVGEVLARVGERRLDVPVLLRKGQALGSWHVRVKLGERTVIDRDVLVFDPRESHSREVDAGH
jgi:hypothetical protein